MASRKHLHAGSGGAVLQAAHLLDQPLSRPASGPLVCSFVMLAVAVKHDPHSFFGP